MESLPFEITELITANLDVGDMFQCITVSQGYYSSFMKHLYSEVKLKDVEEWKLFLESVINYPRCQEAGKYLKTIHFPKPSASDQENIMFIKRNLHNALKHCPGLEFIITYGEMDVLKLFLDPGMPDLYLRYIRIVDMTDSCTEDYMKCNYKYRMSMELLTIQHMDCILNEYNPDTFIDYLGSFPLLTALLIDVHVENLQGVSLFDLIVNHCPNLVYFCYFGDVVSKDKMMPIIEYKSLTELGIHTFDLDSQQIDYFKNKFTRVTNVSMTSANNTGDECDIIDTWMSTTSVKYFCFQMYMLEMDSEEVTSTFWKYAQDPQAKSDKRIKNSATININCKKLESIKVSSECSNPGFELMDYSVDITEASIVKSSIRYERFLKSGRFLTKLVICDTMQDYPIKLETISSNCPFLAELTLEFALMIHTNKCISANHNLKTLSLNQSRYPSRYATPIHAILTNIQLAYPSLQNLHMIDPRLSRDGTSTSNYLLQLPAKIQHLTIQKDFPTSEWSAVVVKEVNSVQIQSWHWCTRSQKMITTQKKDNIVDLSKSFFEKYFILSSSCVHTVEFSLIE
ncbi:hypothetical protein BDB01DRAFT_839129 [Pilobolus umbonatus]|nr:hypothetical protein BDB01DRAFT_839129 [Pilobolus umbonatus]